MVPALSSLALLPRSGGDGGRNIEMGLRPIPCWGLRAPDPGVSGRRLSHKHSRVQSGALLMGEAPFLTGGASRFQPPGYAPDIGHADRHATAPDPAGSRGRSPLPVWAEPKPKISPRPRQSGEGGTGRKGQVQHVPPDPFRSAVDSAKRQFTDGGLNESAPSEPAYPKYAPHHMQVLACADTFLPQLGQMRYSEAVD